MLLHHDTALIAASKPAGLLAVPGRRERDCLAARVQAIVPDALVVHRLDMATSGVMLMARGADAQRALSAAFAERRVHKRYVAIVDGCIEADAGEIELPLAADWPRRPRQLVDLGAGKPSLTRFRVLDRRAAAHGSVTRVALEPVTGRSHQLRVHLAAIGHPILGDALYAPPTVQAAAPRLLLHAESLALAHPADGRWCAFESPVAF